MEPIKVLLVERDRFWINTLHEAFERERDITLVETVFTKKSAIEAANNYEVDIVLMDINLTETYDDGMETIKLISGMGKIKVIVLTNATNKGVIIETIESGAMNLIHKLNVKDIVTAIRESHMNKSSIHSDCAEVIRGELIKMKKLSNLTQAEREVYNLNEAGLNKSQIAEALNKSYFTIKNQLKTIRHKLID
ncbi:response regulator transcription factor [Paenibacillus oenotherae]|uniref:Response regulator transcription factor n=1 Tax=Paenibacillus oenotherae TaxID=1435645 RepID=A0ABS7D2E4_9BACL|nr:response regulator transcription factor [Paenibacillus oenotherae]MBW7474107.1 response regulator transcription factor [Paenibacillus oenotherae]